ncbi:DUF5655 domain-containing protein [Shewanella sp. NIFS-20-20]|uniref:DUF5655 domain-containing protein n=1 Tax=Shewanella sp. NIFS-20-20 TaxID=2853806 RepID=UPI001C489346|nr:DUF5655 domain-containing protein [Shewanella sp. NIFS-20-20]MBV7315990.1 DUF4287 domain-containing protein [Shewanella sp. NIFS-20-20]
MADPTQALATQLANIEKRTQKSLAELVALVQQSPLSKHGELVAMLKNELNMGHGDANTLVHVAKQANSAALDEHPDADPLSSLYLDKKAHLLPIHQALLQQLLVLGEFESAPKKTYISYRCKKQFCMIGPATNTQLEIGLNVKQLEDSVRLKVMPVGRMCQYTVRVSSTDEIDAELIGWLKAAYVAAS